MAEEPNYECLPQRAPRQKRRRVQDDQLDVQDTAIDDKNGPVASEHDAAAAAAEPVEAPSGGGAQESPEKNDSEEHHKIEKAAEYRSAAVPGHNFEYLDHTADVQLHAWGSNLQEAFESVALCMFNYMTPLKGISIDKSESSDTHRTYEAEGHDLPSLLFHWLDELLFGFSTDFFVPKELQITKFDREAWKIEAKAKGEVFDRQRHVSGTEIKAITYSAMQINEKEGDAEVFVIVDI